MVKITEAMIQKSYSVAKRVYNKEISPKEGTEEICRQTNMNESSARGHIDVYPYLRNGRKYGRGMNGYATKYYLQNIYDDFGRGALAKALEAVDLHILYNQSHNYGRLNNIREIADDFKKLLKTKTGDTK